MKLRERYGEVNVTFQYFDSWEDAERELSHDDDDCPTYIYIMEEEQLYKVRY